MQNSSVKEKYIPVLPLETYILFMHSQLVFIMPLKVIKKGLISF
jgi:hypothetical protein